MATLTGDINYCTNPSFEVDTTGWIAVSGNLTRVTTDHWVGTACAQLEVTGVASDPRFEFTGDRPAFSEGAHAHVHARVKGPVGRNVRLHIEQRDAGTATLQGDFSDFITCDGSWQRITVSATGIANAVDFTLKVRATINGTGAENAIVGDDFFLDGVDIRLGAAYDTYIDGDQGSIYTWDGIAHDSTSRRATVEVQDSTGSGGVIKMSASLYRTDRNNRRIEDISEDIIEGTVTFDQDAEIKMSFTGRINDITELTPYVDFVTPVLSLTYADGTEVEEPLGHYIVVPAPRRYTYTSIEGDIDGRGIEWLLHIDEFATGYRIEAGNDFVTEVVSILRDMDLPNINIPLSGKTVPKKRGWKAGTKKIEVVNSLLDAAGYTPLFSGRDGSLRAFKLRNMHRTQPAVVYDAAGVGSDLVGVITETPDMTNFANRFIVLAEDAQRNVIRVIVRNDNQASPTSIPRLGFTKTRTHTSKNINNEADARELATRMLERAARHLVKLEIETLPDPSRNPYEVYTIRARQDSGEYAAFGNYACTGWTIGFTPQQGSMKHKVERLEIYE